MGVGFRLKKILRERGMTIKRLSEISGVSVNTLYSITKRDSERVDPVIIQKIADALFIPILDLYDDEGWIRENVGVAKDIAQLIATLQTIYKADETPTVIKRFIEGNFPNFNHDMDTLCASMDSVVQASMGKILDSFSLAYSNDEMEIMLLFRGMNEQGVKAALEVMKILATNPNYQRDQMEQVSKSE